MAKKISKNIFYTAVGIISLLISIWIVMYAVPSLFVNLFNTFLGNIILLGIVLLIAMFNKNVSIVVALILIVLYQFSHMTPHMTPRMNSQMNANK